MAAPGLSSLASAQVEPSAPVLSPPLLPNRRHGTQIGRVRDPERPWAVKELQHLAWPSCPQCLGSGSNWLLGACTCVKRRVFELCWSRYRNCLENDPRGWNRKEQEYVADFESVARRTLSASEWVVFRRLFLQGNEVRLLRAEAEVFLPRLGSAFRNLRPYPLFTLDSYFTPAARGAN